MRVFKKIKNFAAVDIATTAIMITIFNIACTILNLAIALH